MEKLIVIYFLALLNLNYSQCRVNFVNIGGDYTVEIVESGEDLQVISHNGVGADFSATIATGALQKADFQVKIVKSSSINSKCGFNQKNSGNSGSYANPGRGLVELNEKLTNEQIDGMRKLSDQMERNVEQMNKNLNQIYLYNANNTGDIQSLENISLNGYKYAVIRNISSFIGRKVPKLRLQIKEILSQKGFIPVILGATYDKYGNINKVSYDDLDKNKNLAIYLDFSIENEGAQGALIIMKGHFKIFTYDNMLLHYRTYQKASTHNEIAQGAMSKFINQPYSFDLQEVIEEEEIEKYKQSIKDDKNEIQLKNNNELKKDKSIKELKKLKDLLDSGILTKEEYDRAAAPHKKIVLGL